MFLFKLQLFAHKTKKTAIRWGSAVCGVVAKEICSIRL